MAKPDDIDNGDVPDANVLMTWLNHLVQGNVDDIGATYDAIINSVPGNYQFRYATDTKQLLFYTRDVTQGDNGWVGVA